jgi:peptidyl-Asp metalloendopeptidase
LTTGEATGSAATNNALSMTNTKAIVAAFRSAAVTLPGAPGSLSAVALSSSQIALTWLDNSSNETGFRLERSADGTNWSEFAVVGSNATSFTDTGLTGATSYQYRARAFNSAGNSSYSNIGTATTDGAVVDTIAPTVSILNPSSGAKVRGTVYISVNASDNVGVSSLKLFIDGKLVSSGNASSLSYSWNTRKASVGTHTISSEATDPSSNKGSKAVSVTK